MSDPAPAAPSPEAERFDAPATAPASVPLLPRRRLIDWRPLALEAFFVVLGVVLALGANEWRQAAAERRNAERALAAIQDELETNRAAIVEAVEYHRMLLDTLGALRRSDRADGPRSATPDLRLFSRGFAYQAPLVSTAWDAAGATDAVRHMTYSDVLALARVYEAQDRYASQSEQIGQLIYGTMFREGFGGILRNYGNLTSIISTLWFRECELLAGYDIALGELDGPRRRAAAPPSASCRQASMR